MLAVSELANKGYLMCFSASASYSAAAVLITAGSYTIYRSGGLSQSYKVIALAPVLFGIQQLLEGRVWQFLNAQDTEAALPYALGFHFFSHFLWLWLIPLLSLLIEPDRNRRWLFLAISVFGGTTGGMVYFSLLAHPDWMSIYIQNHSIIYQISPPYHAHLLTVVPPSTIYALVILIPLLLSSHRHINIFGILIALSAIFTSVVYGYAFVSVWCFFAAITSIYIVFMIAVLSNGQPGH